MIEEIFLLIIVIELAILLFFNFKKLPVETQKEIQRKVGQAESNIIEWQPPQEKEKKAFKDLVETIIKK